MDQEVKKVGERRRWKEEAAGDQSGGGEGEAGGGEAEAMW